MGLLDYDEINTNTEIKRTLKLDGSPIAVAYIDTIDQAVPYFTLWWRLNKDVSLDPVIKHWLKEVLPYNGIDLQSVPTVLESWISGEFHETEFKPPVSLFAISEQIHNMRKDHDVIEHLLLNSQDRVVEFSFEKNQPTRCFCTFKELVLWPFKSFFSMYHEDAKVRSQDNLLYEACKNFNLFDPIPVHL